MTLQELKVDLLADGIIDAEEVSKLKGILYADGIIDKDEAEFLFEIKRCSNRQRKRSFVGSVLHSGQFLISC